ncbi:MAG: HD domain-containing phosphohydrolase [Acidimicrobiia bacterium]
MEVNDRMLASSSVMAIATAATYFALRGDGAATAVVMIAAFGPFDSGDFKKRHIFQPAFNFGLLTLSALASGVVVDFLLWGDPDRGRAALLDVDPSGGVAFFQVAAVGAAAAAVYAITNFAGLRIGVRIAYGRRNVMPWSGLGVILGSMTVMGILGGMLGAVLVLEESVAFLALIVVVYGTGHTVFTSYAELRVAHESTLRGFVKTLETRDLYTRGHTERVAYFCRLVGSELGFTGTQLEHMRWAALIHDMGKLAIPIELMQKQGKLTDDEYRRLRTATHKVDDLLSEVDFLRPMVDVASGAHPSLPSEDYGQVGHHHTTKPTLEQKVLAVADAFDAMTSTRGYRMAMSQKVALQTLKEDSSPLYDADVVDALALALGDVGETYGPPHLMTSELSEEVASGR